MLDLIILRMNQQKFLQIFLISIIFLCSCSSGGGDPKPEPEKPIEAKLTINSVNYEKTVGDKYLYTVKGIATVNVSGTLTIDNDEGQTFTLNQVKSNVAFSKEITFTHIGVHEVLFEIKDSKGKEAFVKKSVNIDDKAPVITVSSNYENTDSETNSQRYSLTFKVVTKEGSFNASIDINGETKTLSQAFESNTEYTEELVFTTIGEKTIILTVTDVKGNVGTKTLTTTVEDRIPSIDKWGHETVDITVENDVATSYNYKFKLITNTFENKTFNATLKINGEIKIEQEGLTSSEEKVFDYSFATHGTYNAVIEVVDVDGNSNSESIEVDIEEYVAEVYNIYDPFIQPFIHSRFLGKIRTDFYGSGDVNQDGKILDSEDISLISSGTVNTYTDINRDGKTDGEDISAAKEGPGNIWAVLANDYWNKDLTNNQRAEFCTRTHARSNDLFMQSQMPGWYCTKYSQQSIINIQGISDVDGWLKDENSSFSGTPEFTTSHNGLFNLFCCEMSSVIESSGGAHSVIAFPIGNDLTKIENWLFIDAASKTIVTAGSFYMKAGEISRIVICQTGDDGSQISTGLIIRATIQSGYWENIVPGAYVTSLTN